MPSQTSQSRPELKKGQQKSQPQNPIRNPLDFFKERGGIVIESDHGWCNYYVINGVAFLENLYIYPDARKEQNGTYLLSVLEMKLKELEGINEYFTTISRRVGDENRSLAICLKRGFKLFSMNSDAIILKKEL